MGRGRPPSDALRLGPGQARSRSRADRKAIARLGTAMPRNAATTGGRAARTRIRAIGSRRRIVPIACGRKAEANESRGATSPPLSDRAAIDRGATGPRATDRAAIDPGASRQEIGRDAIALGPTNPLARDRVVIVPGGASPRVAPREAIDHGATSPPVTGQAVIVHGGASLPDRHAAIVRGRTGPPVTNREVIVPGGASRKAASSRGAIARAATSRSRARDRTRARRSAGKASRRGSALTNASSRRLRPSGFGPSRSRPGVASATVSGHVSAHKPAASAPRVDGAGKRLSVTCVQRRPGP